MPPARLSVVLFSLGRGLFAASARAEFRLSIFTGVALSQDSDLDLHQTGGTDLTFHDVSFKGRDFETPPFYGARLLYFLPNESHWGFGAEFSTSSSTPRPATPST